MIRFKCPTCATPIEVDDSAAGKSTKCRKCGEQLRISGGKETPKSKPEQPSEVIPLRIPAVTPGMLPFECPQCNKLLEVPPAYGGRMTNCPGCGARIEIPIPVDEVTFLRPRKPVEHVTEKQIAIVVGSALGAFILIAIILSWLWS